MFFLKYSVLDLKIRISDLLSVILIKINELTNWFRCCKKK